MTGGTPKRQRNRTELLECNSTTRPVGKSKSWIYFVPVTVKAVPANGTNERKHTHCNLMISHL